MRATAELLASLGHDVEEVDPHYPEAAAPFMVQYFGALRREADMVERRDLLERRTRETVRLGAWVRPRTVEWAIRQGEEVARKANRVFDDVDVLLTPTMANRPPVAGSVQGLGTVRSLLKSLPASSYAALWNVTGNPAANVPVGFGSDGLPLGVQIVGRRDDETTLLSLAAQVEKAQPWTDRRPAL